MTVYATDPTQLADEVMHCRAFGHQWTDTGALAFVTGPLELLEHDHV